MRRTLLFVLLLTLSFSQPVLGQVETTTLTAANGALADFFGFDVDYDGQRAVVGASARKDNGAFSGAAYVFRRDGADWTEEGFLLPSDGEAGIRAGYSVGISGDLAIVGADQDNDFGARSGSAYIFRLQNGTWVEEAKITASDAAQDAFFGSAVAIDGDVAVVGAWKADGNGAAYVFRHSGGAWVEETKLSAHGTTLNSEFGLSVDIRGGLIAVGAHGDDGSAPGIGAVYLYRDSANGFVEEAKLHHSDAAQQDRMGFRVATDGVRVVAGAHRDEVGTVRAGSARVFSQASGAWEEEAILTSATGVDNDDFGIDVAIDGEWLAVGARGEDAVATNSGAIYLYRLDGGTFQLQQRYGASDAGGNHNLGNALAVAAGIVVSGVPLSNGVKGSAYVFGSHIEPVATATIPSLPSLALFPNPASSELRIALPLGGAEVQVFDLLGRTLLTRAYRAGSGEAQLDLSGFSAGSYLVRVASNGRVISKPFVLVK